MRWKYFECFLLTPSEGKLLLVLNEGEEKCELLTLLCRFCKRSVPHDVKRQAKLWKIFGFWTYKCKSMFSQINVGDKRRSGRNYERSLLYHNLRDRWDFGWALKVAIITPLHYVQWKLYLQKSMGEAYRLLKPKYKSYLEGFENLDSGHFSSSPSRKAQRYPDFLKKMKAAKEAGVDVELV